MRRTEFQIEELQIKVEDAKRRNLLNARDISLSAARFWFRDRSEEATPEQILSVAAKFEAYLTAPETVLSEREDTR